MSFGFPDDPAPRGEISFIYEDTEKRLDSPFITSQWIKDIVHKEGRELDFIQYVFCSDKYLHKINLEYLNHDTYTDIITFSLSDECIESDIFISMERVGENASERGIPFEIELHRVIIHGVLHLCGYGDKTDEEKALMREKEEEALGYFLNSK